MRVAARFQGLLPRPVAGFLGLVPTLSLWALALWPRRPPGAAGIEAALGAITFLQGHEVLRRAVVQALLRPRLDQDLLAGLGAACGFCLSLIALALEAHGSLPPSLTDPRGGPRLLLAEGATFLLVRRLAPALSAGAGPRRLRPGSTGEPRGSLPRGAVLITTLATAAALIVAVVLVHTEGGAVRLALALMSILGCLSIEALVTTRVATPPRAAFLELTGVLTRGAPEVVGVQPMQATDRPEDVLHLAAVVEYPVAHPVREAIFRACKGRFPTVLRIPGIDFLPSRGIRASYMGSDLLLGNLRLFRESRFSRRFLAELDALSKRLAGEGDSLLFLASGTELRGAISLRDPLREEALKAIRAIRNSGTEVHILSGDSRPTVEALLRRAGPIEIHAELTREERARVVEDFRASGQNALHCRPEEPRKAPRSSRGRPRSPLERCVRRVRRAWREQTTQRQLGLATGCYHAVTLSFLSGTLEPWTGTPPLPLAACVTSAVAPLILSFVFEALQIYNCRFTPRRDRRKRQPWKKQLQTSSS